MSIQLPDDVIDKGYKKIGNFEHAQIFYSQKNNFTGTELEFLEAKLAYQYTQLDKFTRITSID